MDKQMIRIPTDATNLSTDCIGISSTPRTKSKKMRGRGRPKGSKSKTTKTSRKRTATQSQNECTQSPKLSPYNTPPRRKKRKPNKAHRDAFPDHTDEDIRRQLALERKAKNRKSAQESRERRKKQETYLNQRLPKGLALKALLQSTPLHNTSPDIDIENDSLEVALSRDAELSEMKMILDEMCDNFASEYDEYPRVQRDRNEISDELIIDILKEYVNGGGDSDGSEDDLVLETDRDAIHLQVIGEIENGVPMQVDDIPESATPNAFKATRGRKKMHKKKHNVRLKTPPTIPYIHQFSVTDTELPPPVFGTDNIDFNIAPESAVSPYPMPQDTMLHQYHIQSLYNRSTLPCIIKHEKLIQLNPIHHLNHLNQFPKFPQIPPLPQHINNNSLLTTEQTPSTISTNSTISNHSDYIKKETQIQPIPSLMSLVPTTLPALPCHYPQHTHHPITLVHPSITIPTQKVVMEAVQVHHPSQIHSPMYTTAPIAPCLHTPEQMHFIHPLPARVPQVPTSPIIHHSTQQDIQETKQMLIMQPDHLITMDMDLELHSHNHNGKVTGNNGKNGKSFRSGKSSNIIKNGEMEMEMELDLEVPVVEEMRILAQLVQVVQSFIIIICGMAMVELEVNLENVKNQYVEKMKNATVELTRVVLGFVGIKLGKKINANWELMETEIVKNYVPEIINSIRQHPLLPLPNQTKNRRMMDVTCHYQAYRQIAMEILQNMKQQMIYYQHKSWGRVERVERVEQVQQVVMKEMKEIKKEDLNLKNCKDLSLEEEEMQVAGMKSILLQPDYFGEYQMNRIMDFSQGVLTEYNENLQEKCFKILSSKIK